MAEIPPGLLLDFARHLLPTNSFGELLAVARDAVIASVGYRHVWLMVADQDDADELRLIDFSGDRRQIAWEVAPTLRVRGDKFLEQVVASDGPLVIEDARTDPRTNKQLVEQLQNRTIINIPLRLLDRAFGVFGIGTFGDEGCRAPTEAELNHLVAMAGQIAVAAARMRFVEAKTRADRERLDLERHLLQIQKLESLGMLAGGIAHDFNNLLTVIMSCAGLAADRTAEAAVRDEMRTIAEAATRGRDLTRKLLAMGRRQDLDLKALDVNECLTELTVLMRRVLPENIQIDLIKAVRLPLIEGDPSQIDQVFMNLSINARDAMSKGGRLTLETEQVVVNGSYVATHPWAKPGRYVLTTVTDTGVGISRDVLERIFEPFFTTKTPDTGTGLGLAVAYGIVRQHGGMLHCYSEPDVGTSFKVYLPAVERMATAVGNKLVGSVPKSAGGERILVAEDDPAVRSVSARILQQAGYRVITAENGATACDIVGRESVDLVVLDMVMPGMTCREIVNSLRALRPSLRIILSSGYSAGTNVAELLRDTGLELVRKPYDPDQLLFVVRGALSAVASVPA
ncbi:MAG: ATP-binding protein [Verrucomicrobiota bacterium]